MRRILSRVASTCGVVLAAGAAGACADHIVAPGQAPTQPDVVVSSDPCTSPVTLTLNQTVDGTIAQSDCALSDGRYADVYTVAVSPGGKVRVHMSSSALDAYVSVTSSTGTVWADDDSGAGTDARLEATLTAGTYTIRATSKAAGGLGAYRLWIGRDAPPTITTLTFGSTGQTVDESVTHSEWLMPRGTYADVYRFTLSASANVRVNMMGSGFKPYVLLRGITNTAVSFASDTSVAANHTEVEALLQAGTYEIRATSAVPEGAGAYRLWVGPRAAPLQPVSLGAVVEGEISSADWLMPRRTHADAYSLTLTAPTTLRVGMASDDLDPYVTILAGSVSYVDDDGGFGTDAILIQQLPAGTYQIRATTKTLYEDGAYRLSVDVYRAPMTLCTSSTLPQGYVVVSATSTFSCPNWSTSYPNQYGLRWPYGDETLTICSGPASAPAGWVIIAAGSSSNCPSGFVSSYNTHTIKLPDEREEICNASTLPAGYVIVAQGSDSACPNWSATRSNTWFIERT